MVGGVEVTVPAESVEMRCSRERITLLSQAKQADLKAAGWTNEKGGEAFNSLIEKFKGEDAGEIATTKPTRPSVKDLTEKAAMFKSPAIRSALLVAAGDQEAGKAMVEMDDQLTRLTMILDSLRNAADKFTDPNVSALVKAILDDKLPAGEVEILLKPLVTA